MSRLLLIKGDYLSGQAMTVMLVYIWARRNPFVRMNFFGLFTFPAPYLPWVLLAFSLLLGNSVAVDLLGIAVGHFYFFLEDVFPNQPGGFKLLKTPALLKVLCDPSQDDPDYRPLPEERPGGYDWGNNNAAAGGPAAGNIDDHAEARDDNGAGAADNGHLHND